MFRLLALFLVGAHASELPSFEDWEKLNEKHYSSASERNLRREIFESNMAYIADYNSRSDRDYDLGATPFVDEPLFVHETSLRGNSRRVETTDVSKYPSPVPNRTSEFVEPFVGDGSAIPRYFSWVDKGVVPSVKNQGRCNSCWASAVTAAVEQLVAMKTNIIPNYSEQHLIDCSLQGSNSYGDRFKYRNQGCKFGYVDDTYKFAKDVGLVDEATYPFGLALGNNGVGTCRCNLPEAAAHPASTRIEKRNIDDCHPTARISGWVDLPSGDEESLLRAVMTGPVLVAIKAEGIPALKAFRGRGLFTGDCGFGTDHVLVAVGFGIDESGTRYLQLKNSWGKNWGDDGYLKLPMDKEKYGVLGQCGMLTWMSKPVLGEFALPSTFEQGSDAVN